MTNPRITITIRAENRRLLRLAQLAGFNPSYVIDSLLQSGGDGSGLECHVRWLVENKIKHLEKQGSLIGAEELRRGLKNFSYSEGYY